MLELRRHLPPQTERRATVEEVSRHDEERHQRICAEEVEGYHGVTSKVDVGVVEHDGEHTDAAGGVNPGLTHSDDGARGYPCRELRKARSWAMAKARWEIRFFSSGPISAKVPE